MYCYCALVSKKFIRSDATFDRFGLGLPITFSNRFEILDILEWNAKSIIYRRAFHAVQAVYDTVKIHHLLVVR